MSNIPTFNMENILLQWWLVHGRG